MALHEETFRVMKVKRGPDHPATLTSMTNLALAYLQAGRPRDALPLLEGALGLTRTRSGPAHPDTVALMDNLALAYVRARRRGPGRAAAPPGPGVSAAGRRRAGRHRQGLGPAGPLPAPRRPARRGRASLRDCLAIREKAVPDDWLRFNAMSLLGGSLLGQKKYADAEPMVLGGYEGMKARQAAIPPAARYLLADAGERIIALYQGWGKTDRAAEWRARLEPAATSKPPSKPSPDEPR